MDYDEQVGKKERNPKCHNTSQVINMGSRSCEAMCRVKQDDPGMEV